MIKRIVFMIAIAILLLTSLSIKSKDISIQKPDLESKNVSVQKLDLPYEKKSMSETKIYHGYYYYTGENSIYRAPVSDPGDVSKVCDKKTDQTGYSNPFVSFFEIDDELYISYRIGSGAMGGDIYCRVNTDGIGEEVISPAMNGSINFRMAGNGRVVVRYGAPPSSGNLYYVDSEQQKRLGNPAYMYGWIRKDGGYMGSRSMEIIDGWVYIIATEADNRYASSKVYKIHIDTNEILLVSDIPTEAFSIIEDTMYFISREDGKLYSKALTGDQTEVLVDASVWTYVVEQDAIYYTSRLHNELFRQDKDGTVRCLMPKRSVFSMEISNDHIICILNDKEEYGLVVLDKKGNPVFKTPDRVVSASAERNLLVYKTYETQENYRVQLP